MKPWLPHRGSPDGSLPSQSAPRHVRPRKVLAAGAVIATIAAMGTLTTGGSARAALAPGTPLKTLAAAQGNRYFGSSMTQSLLSNSTATQLQAQQFNMLTPANELKWDAIEPSNGGFNFTSGDAMVSYATTNNERVRCNNLVWHSQLPAWVSSLPASQVQAAMETHITTEATHFKGKCYAWDVVNEPFNDDGTLRTDVFSNAMGSGYIADALKKAHAADPNAKLYLNDFNIEGMNAKSNAMFSLAQSLLAAGVPLNGIGFESHFIVGQGVPSDMQANMQRFANLGLDVALTELDDRMVLPASAANLQQQATDFASAVKDCLGVNRCVGVSTFGVGDADSTVPLIYVGMGAATMFDVNYNPKPAFFAVQTVLGGSNDSGPTITNPGPQKGVVGVPVTPVTVMATDPSPGATLSWSVAGLPGGLALAPSGSSATISGTPTSAGVFAITVTVTDSTGAQVSVTFTWTIIPPGLTITNPGLQHGKVGVPITPVTLTVSGASPGGTLTVSATGLPAGLVASIGSAGSVVISGTPTVAGTSSTTVTVTDGTTSATVSFTWLIDPASGCKVTYTPNNYPGGFTVNITLANTGTTAINGWTLTFTFPGDQKITSTWNGTTTQSGQNASITNVSYNANIPASSSIQLGFQGTWTSNNTSPTSFAVNGATCS